MRGFKVINVVFILNILFLLFTKVTLNFFLFDQLRYVFTFFYLTFIPGFLLSKLLKLEKIESLEVILYSVGLSLFFMMVLGFGINTLGIYFSLPLIKLDTFVISYVLLTSLLTVIISIRNDKLINDFDFNLPYKYLVLVFISISTSIIGVFYLFYYNFNIILILMYLAISLMPILVAYGYGFNKNVYLLLIFIIAVCLLFNRSLLSPYISGWDIQQEFYLSSLVLKNSAWDYTLSYDVNGMLSIVMLAPIYSLILNIDLIWMFKVIYPLLFSLVPCCLYLIFRREFNEKIAFLSCCYVMFLYTFFFEMPQLGRQEIAEFFLVMVVFTFTNRVLSRFKKYILTIIFLISLSISHYGLTYFTVIFFAFMIVSSKILESKFIDKLIYGVKINAVNSADEKLAARADYYGVKSLDEKNDKIINLFVLAFLVFFTVTWNQYTASSATISQITILWSRFVEALSSGVLNTTTSAGLNILLMSSNSLIHQLTRYLHLFLIFLISLGIVYLLLNYTRLNYNSEYKSLVLANFVTCIGAIFLPYVSNSLNTTRLFHITTLMLAPMVIVGFHSAALFFNKFFKTKFTYDFSIKALSIVLCAFMLFNSGWVYQVTDDHPTSYLLNNKIDSSTYNEFEVAGGKWWDTWRTNQSIYADLNRFLLLQGLNFNATVPAYYRLAYPTHISISNDMGVFFGTYNLDSGKFFLVGPPSDEYVDTEVITEVTNKIYSNSRCDIYYKSR